MAVLELLMWIYDNAIQMSSTWFHIVFFSAEPQTMPTNGQHGRSDFNINLVVVWTAMDGEEWKSRRGGWR